jgi:hypothetical protein
MAMNPVTSKAPLIHIGYPKAMSSWLQKHFFSERCGFQVVMNQIQCQLDIIKPAPFHFSTGNAQKTLLDFSATNSILTPVFTAEALSGNMYCGGYNSKEIADRLALIAPNAKVLILFREQKSLIRSLYKSWITWGMPQSIEEILCPAIPDLAPQFRLEYLEFDRLIDYYQSLFGPERVLALPYEGFLKTPYVQLRKIHQFSGAPAASITAIDQLPILGRVNRGQSLTWLYWLRWQNRLLYKTPFSRFGLIDASNDLLLHRIAKSKKNRLPDFTKAWFEESFQHTVRHAVGDHYKDSNRKTSDLLGIDLQEYGYDC